MNAKRLLALTVLSLGALASAASADRHLVGFDGGSWRVLGPNRLSVWANSPRASLTLDNRSNNEFYTAAVDWSNLMAGSFLSTPEGVVVASTREGGSLTSQHVVPAGERQRWALHPNVNGAYRFAVVGSTHHPETGQRVFGDLSREMAAQKMQFAIHLGDAVGDGRQLPMFREQLKTFPFPTYVLMGEAERRAGRSRWEGLFGKLPVSFQVAQDRFVLLDNAEGTLGGSQRAWLEQTLATAAADGVRHVFVFMHRPPVDPRVGVNQGMTGREEVRQVLDLFKRRGVKAVFGGHVPMYARKTWRGVDTIVSGGGGAKPYGAAAAGGFHHYMQVAVDRDKVTIAPVPWGN